MSLEGKARVASYEKWRTTIYIAKQVAMDSKFPFKAGDRLGVRIENRHLIVYKRKAKPRLDGGWTERWDEEGAKGAAPSKRRLVRIGRA